MNPLLAGAYAQRRAGEEREDSDHLLTTAASATIGWSQFPSAAHMKNTIFVPPSSAAGDHAKHNSLPTNGDENDKGAKSKTGKISSGENGENSPCYDRRRSSPTRPTASSHNTVTSLLYSSHSPSPPLPSATTAVTSPIAMPRQHIPHTTASPSSQSRSSPSRPSGRRGASSNNSVVEEGISIRVAPVVGNDEIERIMAKRLSRRGRGKVGGALAKKISEEGDGYNSHVHVNGGIGVGTASYRNMNVGPCTCAVLKNTTQDQNASGRASPKHGGGGRRRADSGHSSSSDSDGDEKRRKRKQSNKKDVKKESGGAAVPVESLTALLSSIYSLATAHSTGNSKQGSSEPSSSLSNNNNNNGSAHESSYTNSNNNPAATTYALPTRSSAIRSSSWGEHIHLHDHQQKRSGSNNTSGTSHRHPEGEARTGGANKSIVLSSSPQRQGRSTSPAANTTKRETLRSSSSSAPTGPKPFVSGSKGGGVFPPPPTTTSAAKHSRTVPTGALRHHQHPHQLVGRGTSEKGDYMYTQHGDHNTSGYLLHDEGQGQGGKGRDRYETTERQTAVDPRTGISPLKPLRQRNLYTPRYGGANHHDPTGVSGGLTRGGDVGAQANASASLGKMLAFGRNSAPPSIRFTV